MGLAVKSSLPRTLDLRLWIIRQGVRLSQSRELMPELRDVMPTVVTGCSARESLRMCETTDADAAGLLSWSIARRIARRNSGTRSNCTIGKTGGAFQPPDPFFCSNTIAAPARPKARALCHWWFEAA